MDKYDHNEIEAQARKKWQELDIAKLYQADEENRGKEKKYILDMFPYPSADGLHTGHVESYTATDIVSRYLRLRGFNVLHPQGFDAFGLPAENFAIKTKTHPAVTTQKAIKNFQRQMDMMGLSYDWSRMVDTSQPEYYKWTQWFFLLLYNNGLAYRAKAKVNWCKKCQTVLANEQAEDGLCERCQNAVEQKDLEQWFFKITDFIEDNGETSGLLSGLDKIDWPESTKAAQRNWIGKSEGAVVKFKVKSEKLKIAVEMADFFEIFTTRLDTIFGCTFCIVAPEHPLLEKLKPAILNWLEVEKYIERAKNKTDRQRISEMGERTGVEIKGVKAVNPFTQEEILIYISDFVLAHYGTGAVMGVPAHDYRDFAFAKKYGLEIREVILPADTEKVKSEKFKVKSDSFPPKADPPLTEKLKILDQAYVEDGILINSEKYNGLTSGQAREKMVGWLEANGLGKRTINYKIRDWLVSRQRYWGAPIPIVYCQQCGEAPVPEKDLPVFLPDDVDFMPHGESPLVKSKKFHEVKCPKCGAPARRESDTMDTFVCSSWYYFRYADPHNKNLFASKEQLKKWLPVDLYVGGAEHTVLHLLYSRFFTKVLHKLGYIDFDEPFLKLRHQGIILAEDGRKMSKSLGNVINPDDVVKEFGADALRMFEMFMGPLEDMKQWNTKGIKGIYRFLEKVRKIIFNFQFPISKQDAKFKKQNLKIEKLIHKTIKKVSEDIENMKFNTAIAQMMIFVNVLEKEKEINQEILEKFLIILSPFAPHLAEVLWSKLGRKTSIFAEKWPEYDLELVKNETIELVIQVNGKRRATLEVSADIAEDEAKKMALTDEKIKKWVERKEISKVIFVKGKLVNIVVK